MQNFLNVYNPKNLLLEKRTCFKNPNELFCLDFKLSNCTKSFQNTKVFEKRLSDFHKMVLHVLKINLPKDKLVRASSGDNKNFSTERFTAELEIELLKCVNYEIENEKIQKYVFRNPKEILFR